MLLTGGFVVAVLLVAGCGGGDTKTVTVAVPPPAESVPDPGQATAPTAPPAATTPPETLPALPGGRAAVDGRYRMRVRGSDYEQENIVSKIGVGDESTWPMKSSCTGDVCQVEVRRELESGAYENFTLDEVKERSYAAASTGTVTCISPASEIDPQPTKQRLSLRVSGVAEINGRPTAQRVDAYLTISTKCQGLPTRGIVSWRGTRLP